jgi:hypothetical protein
MAEEAEPAGGPVDFPCFLCGECCSRYQVRITPGEAKCICENLDMDWQEFLETCVDARWPGGSSFLLRHKNGACLFLKRSAGERVAMCSIHSFKPQSCIQWSAGPFRRECRDGLERHWNLKVGDDGGLIGSEEDINRFNDFISSLGMIINDVQE